MVTGTIPVSVNGTQGAGFSKVDAGTTKKIAQSFDKIMGQNAGTPNSLSSEKNNVSDISDKVSFESETEKLNGQLSKIKEVLNKAIKDSKEELTSGAMSELESKIKDVVSEKLGISAEELDNIMAQLGITAFDLTDPQNVAMVIIETGVAADSISLLTDSKVSDLFSTINDEIKNLVSEAARTLELPEVQVKELLKDFSSKDDLKIKNPEDDKPLTKNASANKNSGLTGNQVTGEAESTLESKVKVEVDQNMNQNSENAFANHENNFAGQFATNLTESFANASVNTESFTGYVNTSDILNQFIDSVKVNVNETTSSMELQLHPESLGKILLNVASRDGVITATITATDENVKVALENQLITLKESMNEQGLKVEAVEVTIASHSFEPGRNFEGAQEGSQDSSNESQSKGTRQILADSEAEELNEDELIIQEMMRANGNNVDFTA